MSIITKLSYSLSRLESLEIIHGDFKPKNVMVSFCKDFDNFDCPIIADWDFAYYHKDKTNEQSKATIRYSLLYRPPEMRILQEKDKNNLDNIKDYEFTGREDVYPFGVSIIEFFKTCGITYEEINASAVLFNELSKMVSPISIMDIYNSISVSKDKETKNIEFNGKELLNVTGFKENIENSKKNIETFKKNIEIFRNIIEIKQKEIESEEKRLKKDKQTESEQKDFSSTIQNDCKLSDDLFVYLECYYALFSLWEKYKHFYDDLKDKISQISKEIKDYAKEISSKLSLHRPTMKNVYLSMSSSYISKLENPFKLEDLETKINIKWQDHYKKINYDIKNNKLVYLEILYISDESKEFLAEYPDILCPTTYFNTSYDNIKNDKPLLTYGTIEEICTNIAMKNGQSPKEPLIDISDASRSFKDLSLNRDNILSQSGSNTTPKVFGNSITQLQPSPEKNRKRRDFKR